jgi:acyl transferase domain-containing protein
MTSGTCAITDVPEDRWDIRKFYDPNPAMPGKTRACRGGFLNEIDQFDAHFFGIAPREADHLDPQQRLLLEVAWEALEDAGAAPEKLAGSKTGVFVGGFTLDYKLLQFNGVSRNELAAHTATGVVMTMLANRLSYAFDFRGPSMAVDTACSSSLVAVHLACQSLWDGESVLALAGGVNIMIGPDFTIAESKGGFLSPTGQSRAFDAEANGYVRGEGAGIVVLKPLAQAIADKDRVYAVIRGTAVNQDGRTNGITVPSGDSQRAVTAAALGVAGLEAKDVDYIEAHGTGTPVGDPIEANALGAMYATSRPCMVGSVKTNIGHLEAAAGVAGLIKAALCLKHRQIPPHLNLRTPNPAIPFDTLNLHVPAAVTPWPEIDRPARAAVNSFGFGGTNAHAILEEAPEAQLGASAAAAEGRMEILPISARDRDALKNAASSFATFLKGTDRPLASICAAASRRRAHHTHRLSLVGSSPAQMIEGIEAFLGDAAASGKKPRLAFVFSGMGPQWWAMGRQLIEQEPVFRNAIERTDAALRPLAGWSLLEEMLADENASRMTRTEIAQPANFALQVGLAELWQAWGITPEAIIGHSAGEVAAAYLADAMSWDDAVEVIFHRSRLQQRTTGQGRLMATGLPYDEARHFVEVKDGRVSIAAVNSPNSTALAGELQDLENISERLQASGVFARLVHGQVPYHSHYMEPLKTELLESLANLSPRTATIPLYSTVTGRIVEGPTHDAQYWWENVRLPVLFADATRQATADGYTCFLEISPHPVLAGSMSECLAATGEEGSALPSLRRGEDDRAIMLRSLGSLYAFGHQVDWTALYSDVVPHMDLPVYPWQRERYWFESSESRDDRLNVVEHPLLGRRVASPQPAWQTALNKQSLPYLKDHQVMGTELFPGAGYAEMAFSAAKLFFGEGAYALEDIQFHKALFITNDHEPIVLTTLDTRNGVVEIFSRNNERDHTWTAHATIKVRHA